MATSKTSAKPSSSRRAPKSIKQANTLGSKIVGYLVKHETATTEQLAKIAKVSVPEAFSRLWWMANKDKILVQKGKGAGAEWRLTKGYANQLAEVAKAG